MRFVLSFLFVFSLFSAAQAETVTKLYRLDCGQVEVPDLNIFSIRDLYFGKSKTFVSSCYLIQHAGYNLLWDAGLPESLIKNPDTDASDGFVVSVAKTIAEQLTQIGLKPENITHVSVSHGHGDHSGNLSLFNKAILFIQKSEYDALKGDTQDAHDSHLAVDNFRYFIDNADQVQVIEGDYDIFQDGKVQLISLPGHTPGHMGLMVHLENAGPVILSGDQWHFSENRINDGVPTFNFDVKDKVGGETTRKSSAKLEALIKDNDALLIIQHEPKHVHRLPGFPAYLD